MKLNHHQRNRKARGFMLLEVLLAMMVFGIAATGIVLALNATTRISYELDRQRWLTQHQEQILKSVLTTPATLDEFLEEKVITLDEFSAEAIVTITESEIESSNGTLLKNLYQVEILIVWYEDNEKKESVITTLHHFPLYQY